MKRFVFVVILIGSMSVQASAGAVDQTLKIALWSAIAIDRYQTAQWVDYTLESPMTLTWKYVPAAGASEHSFRCACIYEGNRILAGQREKMDAYFDWWANAVEAAPISEWSAVSKLGAAIFAANWIRVVVNNNRSSASLKEGLARPGMTYTGPKLSQFAVLEYRTRF